MNLKSIQENIISFKKELQFQRLCELDWLYEKQLALSQSSILTAENLEEWLAILFRSDRTQRYWTRDETRSSELMLVMAKYNPDMVVTAFRDLFEESRDLEGRIDRFKFYMDEIIGNMRRNSRDFIESWHHQDNCIISYYLMMQYPTTYIYYLPEIHQHSVKNLGAKPLGQAEDLPRYEKMAKTLSIFLYKDQDLINFHLQRFVKEIHRDSRLLTYEFLLFINKNIPPH